MKVINVMNFIRQCDPRNPAIDELLYPTAKAQLEMVTRMDVDHTFLLQYDTLCDQKYIDLFKGGATEKTELGLWLEIVREMTDAVGLPYRSEKGWKWDWHIVPGFSMGYSVQEREMLIDEAMRKFQEVYGFYPRTVASWTIDTHTVNYLTQKYNISAIGICRDQVSTDAYTMIGGYFNQAYYPSKKNVFTPAKTEEMQISVPVFRLLGPDPIHNYDHEKYISKDCKDKMACYTMEAVWVGPHPNVMDWLYKTYYENEDLGFSYSQIGQENTFGCQERNLVAYIREHIEKAKELPGVTFMKMGDTGDWFKKQYPDFTPATAVTALDNWDTEDIQSVYYDSRFYTANLFRHNENISFRALYAFDENAEDYYIQKQCTTFDAVYENQPIVDTVIWGKDTEKCGMYLDNAGSAFAVEKISDTQLKAFWNDKQVVFSEDRIEISGCSICFYPGKAKAEISVLPDAITYLYRGRHYYLRVLDGSVQQMENGIQICPNGEKMTLIIETE